jgi:two-component system, cell cycle sensor histidine kinase and response regulator CckA
MKSKHTPTYEELKRRLAIAEGTLQALRDGQLDTIAGEHGTLVVRLAETQKRADHIKQVLLAIRNVNQLIVSEDDPLRLIERACVNLTETLGYLNAWIVLLDSEGNLATATAGSGFNSGFSAMHARLAAGKFTGCMVQALERDETVVVKNPKTECSDCPLSTEYSDRAGLSRRLQYDGKIYGILAVSVPAVYASDEEEHALFGEMAGDLAFALHKIEAAKRLWEKQVMLARTERIAHIGSWEWNIAEDRVFWSEELFRIFLLDPTESAPSFAEQAGLYISEDMQRLQRAVENCITDGTPYELELSIIRKDGEIRNCVARGQTEIDPDGKIRRLVGSLQDITARKQVEQALKKSEESVREKLEAILSPEGDIGALDLADIMDSQAIQAIMDDFFSLTHIGIGLIDINGKLLVGTGWQDICLKFHRFNPETRQKCIESDALLTTGVQPGAYKTYRCKNNMWDMATPIVVGGKHLGNIFLGQFLYDDETPDYDTFRSQARTYGFNEDEYLEALNRVPRWSHETTEHAMSFFSKLGTLISTLSYSNLKLARTLDERRQAEKALQESEERFRQIYENMAVGVARVSLDFHIEQANEAYCQMLGYAEEELIGKHLRDITQPEIIEENLRLQSQLAAGEIDHFRLEKRFIHKTGQVIHGILDACKVCDSVGNPSYFLGSVVNISDLKWAEQALRESEDRNRLLSDVTMEGILLHKNGIVIDLNSSLANMLGYDREKLLKRNIIDFIHEDDRTIVLESITKDYAPPHTIRIARKDGEYFFGEIESRDFKKHGETWRVSAVRDVTARKSLENQLLQAQKMESVGRLAGGVAHDFNNMLSVILGHTELAMDKMTADDPLHNDLKAILGAARRSADITRQLLAFARKQTIAPKVIDLNETIEGMLKMLRRLIGEDIDLAWLPGTIIWPVRMDPSQIDQILANLCVNARDAIAGLGKLTIETTTVTFDTAYCADHAGFTPGNYVLLTVSDDGCGMERQTLDKLFEPFFTTKDVGKGTGLGLATVYGIVKQNQGFINVYSEPGQGTTFRIYFPAHATVTTQTVPERIAVIPRAQGKETILLVEDEPTILQMTTLMLEHLGYTVLAANTPGKALDLARQHAGGISLLMTDVVMPEMNGRDLATSLQSLYPSLRSLFMSGYTANVIAHHGVLDEGVQFLQKPFSKKDLAIALRQALKEEKSQQL